MSTTRPDVSKVWASNTAPANIQDPDTFVPNKVKSGWEAEIPPFQWFNWLQNRIDLFNLALAERGITSWGVDVNYQTGSLVYYDGDNGIYIARVANVNSEPTITGDWEKSSVQITEANLIELSERINQHISRTNNPHNVTAAQVNAYIKSEIDAKVAGVQDNLDTHEVDFGNPHNVTAAQAGGVPVTGGTYEGAINVEADTLSVSYGKPTQCGITSVDGVFLQKGEDKLGVTSAGVPIYSDGTTTSELLYAGNFKEYKDQYQQAYAVPEPDFYMPLRKDVNILTGNGISSYTHPNSVYTYNVGSKYTESTVDEVASTSFGLLSFGSLDNLANTFAKPFAFSSGSAEPDTTYTGSFPLYTYTGVSFDWILLANNYTYTDETIVFSMLFKPNVSHIFNLYDGYSYKRVDLNSVEDFYKSTYVGSGIYQVQVQLNPNAGQLPHIQIESGASFGGIVVTEGSDFIGSPIIPTGLCGSSSLSVTDIGISDSCFTFGQRITVHGDTSATYSNLGLIGFIWLLNHQDKLYLRFGGAAGSFLQESLGKSIDFGETEYVVVTKSEDGVYSAYRNGVLVFTKQITPPSVGVPDLVADSIVVPHSIEDVRIWQQALTAEQVSTII